MGLVDRLRNRLTRTRQNLTDGLTGLFRGGRPIDAALLEEFEECLYTADLGAVAGEIVEEIARRHRRGSIKGEEDVRTALREMLIERLQDPGEELPLPSSPKPFVVLVVGVNGSGKTTSIAKLAHRFESRGQRVLVGACDTFRAAAADQLEIWAGRVGCRIVRKNEGADPAAVAFEAVETAKAEGTDVVILDTAGRLHTQKNLMAELAKVQRVVGKPVEGAPHEVWLVIDGTNGQNAIAQAQEFTASVEVTGLVVAKLDGTARGGAVFGIQKALGLPVRYVGTGESLELIEAFEPESFVDALLAPS